MDVDVVIAGAGVVGLATAAEFSRRGHDVLVLEAGPGIGSGSSSRNSEVIHGGMYYPTGSLKQRLCVEGRRRLYAYLEARGIPHRKCGKLIVATSAGEVSKIEAIHATGRVNEVEGLSLISGSEARAMEPELECLAGLWSPETGIVDSHGLMLALQGETEDHGGMVAFKTPLGRIDPLAKGGFQLSAGGLSPTALECRMLINCAGLYAQRLAHQIAGYRDTLIPKLVLAKGNYFGFAGRPVFSRLIYPAPVDGGLGVHVTIDLAGRMRFGPDVEWLKTADPDAVDYAVDVARSVSFYDAIRRYWPKLPHDSLTPDYSGCRPKLTGPGEPAADFRIDGPEVHGIDGLVNLFGIESPGLTSSLAIANMVHDLLTR